MSVETLIIGFAARFSAIFISLLFIESFDTSIVEGFISSHTPLTTGIGFCKVFHASSALIFSVLVLFGSSLSIFLPN